MGSAPVVTACAEHRRRPAVAGCSVCGARLCEDCIVKTPVGFKCRRCTGVTAPSRSGSRRRRWAPAAAAAGLALVGVAAFGLVQGGEGEDPGTRQDVAVSNTDTERRVRFRGAGGVDLAGSLTIPRAAASGRVPAVLILSGFGPADRNGRLRNGVPDPLYQDLAGAFADAGVASLRYDKRGTGETRLPGGQPLRFEDLAGDARAALSFLSERAEVAPGGLAVVGHEEGGLLAMRLAASDPRVKGVVAVSTPGRPVVDVFSDDFANTHGRPSGEALRGIVDELRATGALPAPDRLPAEHRDFFPAEQVPYLQDIFSLDPVAEARGVDVPVLIVRGGRSAGISAADAERLAAALGPKAEVVVTPEADHALALEAEQHAPPAGEGGGHDGGHESSGTAGVRRDRTVVSGIVSWVRARLAV